jgi:DNA-binding NarL/FixJ family response regulator
LIVDDHPVVVSGCRSLFAADKTVKIDEAADAKTGHRAFMQKRPDVTVIDIKLPDVSGFELLRRIRKDDPDARIIMFSMNDDPAFVVRAVEMGAQVATPRLLRTMDVGQISSFLRSGKTAMFARGYGGARRCPKARWLRCAGGRGPQGARPN